MRQRWNYISISLLEGRSPTRVKGWDDAIEADSIGLLHFEQLVSSEWQSGWTGKSNFKKVGENMGPEEEGFVKQTQRTLQLGELCKLEQYW